MKNKEIINNKEINLHTNVVKVVGTVTDAPVFSHTYDGVNFYTVRVKVSRSERHTDMIHLFVTEDNLVFGDKTLDTGIRAEFRGYIVQSKLCKLSDLSVRVLEIRETKDNDSSMIYLSGELIKLSESKKLETTGKVVKSVILRHVTDIDDKEWRLTAKAIFWNTSTKLVEERYDVGDEVCIRGSLISKQYVTQDSLGNDTTVTLHEINSALILPIHKN